MELPLTVRSICAISLYFCIDAIILQVVKTLEGSAGVVLEMRACEVILLLCVAGYMYSPCGLPPLKNFRDILPERTRRHSPTLDSPRSQSLTLLTEKAIRGQRRNVHKEDRFVAQVDASCINYLSRLDARRHGLARGRRLMTFCGVP